VQPTLIERPNGHEHTVTLELCRLLRMSTRFARAFALRFSERSSTNAFAERRGLREAIVEARELRVVPFPPLPPAPLQGFPQEELTPDLMIAGIGQGKRWLFQLLVEVKISSPLGQLWIGGRKLAQPAAYAAVWDEIHARDAAELRYVGTVSRGNLPDWRADFDELALSHVRPARDVCWVPEFELSARQALGEMPDGERARFEPELRAFERHIRLVAPEVGIGGRDASVLGRVRLHRTHRRRERAAARTPVE
jgi:hypothetical protein